MNVGQAFFRGAGTGFTTADDQNDQGWKDIKEEKKLEALEYSALKNHRMEMVKPVLTQPQLADISMFPTAASYLATSWQGTAAWPPTPRLRSMHRQGGMQKPASSVGGLRSFEDFSYIIAPSRMGKSQLAASSSDKWQCCLFLYWFRICSWRH